MSADASELRAFATDLRKTSARAQDMARSAVAKTAADITSDAKVFAPVRTGNLRASIGHDITSSSDAVEAEIGPTANYGPFWNGARRRWLRDRFLVRPLTAVSLLLRRLCSR